MDPADVTAAVRLTRLKTPCSALLHAVRYNRHPYLFQDSCVPVLTADQAAGAVEVYADAIDLPRDCISLRARLTSTAPPDVTPTPITDDIFQLNLQLLRYLRITNLAHHVPATADDVLA